ncbi:MAG: hypothetical protein L0Z50_36820 [Verrucomicrobiales bacterium]|nr:hypothetical protein [Verrucomicrobiales bacterium]
MGRLRSFADDGGMREQVYSDDLTRVVIDVEDIEEHRRFFRELKERLKSRFHQIDVRMTTYLIGVV